MFFSRNSRATDQVLVDEEMAVNKQHQDSIASAKIAAAMGRSSASGHNQHEGSIHSSVNQDETQEGSSAPNEETGAVVLDEELQQIAIQNIESALAEQKRQLEGFADRLDNAEKMIDARVASKKMLAVVLALNSYRQLEAEEATIQRQVASLEDLLQYVVIGGCPSILRNYQTALDTILSSAPVPAEGIMKVTPDSLDPKIVVEEVQKLSVSIMERRFAGSDKKEISVDSEISASNSPSSVSTGRRPQSSSLTNRLANLQLPRMSFTRQQL